MIANVNVRAPSVPMHQTVPNHTGSERPSTASLSAALLSNAVFCSSEAGVLLHPLPCDPRAEYREGHTYALNNPLRYVDPDGGKNDDQGKKVSDEGKKSADLTEKEKQDLETSDTDDIDRSTYIDHDKAAFAEREADGQTLKKGTTVEYDLKKPEDRAKAEEAKKNAEAGSPLQPLGGSWQPTGPKEGQITIYDGTRQLYHPNSDQVKWQIKIFVHEVGESLGYTHKQIEDRAKP